MDVQICELRLQDFDELSLLLEAAGASDGFESTQALAKFLRQNHGLSVVARTGLRIVAAVLCRRDRTAGCVNQLAVDPACASEDLAGKLFDKALGKLAAAGIHRFQIRLPAQPAAETFWQSIAWMAQR